MNMEPLPFAKASGTVKENYQQIIDAFGIGYLPMFFQYLGLFPQYLDYITVQIVGSLNNRKFIALTSEVGSSLASLMAEHFSKSGDTLAWRQRYRYSPQFYYFQEDMKRIHDANIKLVFLFIALREAVKGWAVAARRLESVAQPMSAHEERRFVYEDTAESLLPVVNSHINTSDEPQSSTLQKPSHQIEINLLVDYMRLCRTDFDNLLRQAEYLVFRVEAEKMILRTLPLLPELIFSPINVVLKKTAQQRNYGELLYLLSELFPQLAVQKALFSAYMI